MNNPMPLVVDLDGTLVKTDMLYESSLSLIRINPLRLFSFFFWILKGKALIKKKIAGYSQVDVKNLPYNFELIEWLIKQKHHGRKLVLCTASDELIANEISSHLGFFDEVVASNGIINLAGKKKGNALCQKFGEGSFDYVGNSYADLDVWCFAQKAIVVNAPRALQVEAAKHCEIQKIFSKSPIKALDWVKALRIHQWLKNLLIFIPFLAAHKLDNLDQWFTLFWAYISFGLCASSVYVGNDLLDLESDRRHPRKCSRAFASGLIPIWMGLLAAITFLIISFLIAAYVNYYFLLCLITYFLITSVYSLGLKRLILIDCILLALLYTLRIIAGTLAVGMDLSFWLLGFSVFLFLSLAFLKRYAELEGRRFSGVEKIHGRGYYTIDDTLVQSLGTNAGYSAVVILAIYLNSDAVVKLYRLPQIVWCGVPIILFWISWMWMQAHRGNMHDDPLIFAVKDRVSQASGLLLFLVLLIGAIG